MSNVWFCSDLHLGHKNIGKFRAPFISSEEENRQRIYSDWKAQVSKNDDVYVIGDWCFDMELVEEFQQLRARRKFLVRGNHDNFDMGVYTKIFTAVYGLLKYKEFWVSHAPIHPNELRGRCNLHGHVHYNNIDDNRYFNCCPENLWPNFGSTLVNLDQIRQYYENLNVNSS